MIVAVARKLAIALWRYLEQGLVPKARSSRDNVDSVLSSDTPVGRVGCVAVRPHRKLALANLRELDEHHPSCAIVHASSILASRIEAAGYKLMRLSRA
jgi:hypothetical protein